ncbi:MAG: hypothetical protein GC164_11465 [Phycisphaera sp.]|nr:hypothetical protein [Phycisphaera sp.]
MAWPIGVPHGVAAKAAMCVSATMTRHHGDSAADALQSALMKYQSIELHNVCDIIQTPDQPGFKTSRIPLAVRERVNRGAQNMVLHGSGVELRGMLKVGDEARVVLQNLDDNVVPPVAMVYHGCFSGQTVLLSREPTEIKITIKDPAKFEVMSRITKERKLPFDAGLVRVCLPPIHPVRILAIEGGLTYPAPGSTPTKTMLAYGSSITHGAHAIAPHSTYAAQCATQLGVDLVNLGVGGSAQMDSAMADHIAGRDDWDFATFEMGINVRTWPVEKFREAVDHFVSTVVRAHPDKFIFCIDVFTCDHDFQTGPSNVPAFREIVREIAHKQDSPRVAYIDGRTLLRDPGGLTVDLVHPNDIGMTQIGHTLAGVMAKAIHAQPAAKL